MISFELLRSISQNELLNAAAMNYMVLTFLFITMTAVSNKTNKIFTHEPYRIMAGLIFGLFACTSMMMPALVSHGIISDARLPIISFAGIFFGPLAAVAAAIPPIMLRITIGGDSVSAGIVTMVIAMIASGIMGYFVRTYNKGFVPFIWILAYTSILFPLCLIAIILLPSDILQRATASGGIFIPIINMMGSLVLGYMLCQDQKRRTMMNEIINLHDQSKNAAAAKSLFMARMSHELRTPMNSIIGFTDLLRTTKMTDEQRYFLEQLKIAGQTMGRLVSDILDFSKMDAGKVRLKSEPMNLVKLIESSKSLMHPEARAKNITLNLEIDPRLPEWVIGDELRLRQIIINLLTNAIKFTEHGHVTLRASVDSVNGTEHQVSIFVEDSGIGISKDNLRSIFTPFEQVDESLTRTHGGSGLGLSIAQQLTTMMNGKIQLTSTEGQGSIFRVMLPLQSTSPAIANDTNIIQDNTPVADKTILVVEDIAMNRDLVGSMIGKLGYKFECAENGAEALEKIKEQKFDMVFMDLQMPVMNGYDTTRQIREELELDSDTLPIIAFTAHALPEEIARCFEAGMDDFLTKPVEFIELASKIDEWLSGGSDGWDIPQRDGASYQNMPLLSEADLKNFMGFVGHERLHDAYQDFVNENSASLTLIRSKPQDDLVIRGMLHNMTAVSGNLGMKKLSLYTQYLLNQGIARDRPVDKAEIDLLDNIFQESCRTFERYISA